MSKKIEANLVYPGASIIRTHTKGFGTHRGIYTRASDTLSNWQPGFWKFESICEILFIDIFF